MLGLRLDEPLALDGLDHAVDPAGLERMVAGGLAVIRDEPGGKDRCRSPRGGRFLGGGVTAELLA